jgi:hypothetical protein
MKELLNRTKTDSNRMIEVSKKDIIDALLQTGIIKANEEGGQIDMYVPVPGGGDWSNTNLDIDKDCPLIIDIKTTVIS